MLEWGRRHAASCGMGRLRGQARAAAAVPAVLWAVAAAPAAVAAEPGALSSQARPAPVEAPVTVPAGRSLKAELISLLQSHPRILASRNSLEATRYDERRAFSGYLPRVQLNADTGREVIDSPLTRAAGTGTSREMRQKSTLSVTENLFRGFGTVADQNRARSQSEVASWNLETVEQTLLLDGITAYHTVLRQKRMVELAQQNEAVLKEQLALEDERVQRGSGIAVDVLLAKTRLQLAVERRVQLEGQLQEAVARYVQVFDHPPDLATMADSDLGNPSLPTDIERAMDDALNNNPAIKATGGQIDVARYARDVVGSGYYPQVDLVGQMNWEDDVDAVQGIRRDWSILLRFSWELYSGFETSARVSSAASEHSAAQNNHRANVRKVLEDLRIAWQQLLTARERVRLLDNAVAIAEEVFRSRQRLRDAGRETAINVLDAQSEVFGARINHIAALSDAQIAVFRVLFATGMLTPENLGVAAARDMNPLR